MKKLLITTALCSLSMLSLSILWATTRESQNHNGGNQMETKRSYVLELTEENAQQLITHSPTILVVDFYAEWCGPCRNLKPIFEELATELKDQYAFAKINVDNCREIAQKYQVASLPTIMIFSNGQVVEQIVGLVSKETLLEKIEQALKGPQDLSQLSQENLNKKLLQTIQSSCSVAEIKRLLEAGANANIKDTNGLTPLMAVLVIHASRGIDVCELVQLLLVHGASTEFVDERAGQTMQASDLVVMMAQNYKKLAENYEKINQVFTQVKEKQTPVRCTADSCTL